MLQESLTQQTLKPKNRLNQASQALRTLQNKSKTRTMFSIDFGTVLYWNSREFAFASLYLRKILIGKLQNIASSRTEVYGQDKQSRWL